MVLGLGELFGHANGNVDRGRCALDAVLVLGSEEEREMDPLG